MFHGGNKYKLQSNILLHISRENLWDSLSLPLCAEGLPSKEYIVMNTLLIPEKIFGLNIAKEKSWDTVLTNPQDRRWVENFFTQFTKEPARNTNKATWRSNEFGRKVGLHWFCLQQALMRHRVSYHSNLGFECGKNNVAKYVWLNLKTLYLANLKFVLPFSFSYPTRNVLPLQL